VGWVERRKPKAGSGRFVKSGKGTLERSDHPARSNSLSSDVYPSAEMSEGVLKNAAGVLQ
jgi:hypothetical protein